MLRKFEPMKPAPPVTRILMAVSGHFGRLRGSCAVGSWQDASVVDQTHGPKSEEMEIVLLGSAGQVGVALGGALGCFARVTAYDRSTLDLSDTDAVVGALRAARPAVVVNAAAFTDVDRAESEEAMATRINGDIVGVLGEECRAIRAGLVHYSTDFVFDGKTSRPYREDDPTAPLGAYGRSKLAGETALAPAGGPARDRESLRIVADQSGSPTFAGDLAMATALLIHGVRNDPFGAIDHARGVYHMAGGGVADRK